MYDLKDKVNELMIHPAKSKNIGIIKLQMVRESQCLYGEARMNSPEAAAELIKPLFALADREMVVVMSLSSNMEPLALEIAAIGGLDSCQVDIKNIFKHTLLNNAGNIICFHNHPGGKAVPSKEDKDITERIKKSGEILGITLMDHIIIGKDSFYSFKEHNDWE